MKTEENSVEKSTANETKKTKKKKGSPAGIVISVLLFAVLLAADLIGKHYAVKYLTVGQSVEIVKGALYFTLMYNKGMAFGFLDDTSTGMIIVTAITAVIMVVMIIVYVKTGLSRTGLKIILCVIEAGAIGNLVDRILMFTGNLEGVRDFLDISSVQLFSFINGGFNFGICNPADFCVSLGCVALVIYMIYFIAADSKNKEDDISPAVERNEIFKGEYVEKDVSSLEEISSEPEEEKKPAEEHIEEPESPTEKSTEELIEESAEEPAEKDEGKARENG